MIEIGWISEGPEPEFSGGLVWSDNAESFRGQKDAVYINDSLLITKSPPTPDHIFPV
jgi:hypothetical protein